MLRQKKKRKKIEFPNYKLPRLFVLCERLVRLRRLLLKRGSDTHQDTGVTTIEGATYYYRLSFWFSYSVGASDESVVEKSEETASRMVVGQRQTKH